MDCNDSLRSNSDTFASLSLGITFTSPLTNRVKIFRLSCQISMKTTGNYYNSVGLIHPHTRTLLLTGKVNKPSGPGVKG